jgi:phage terminase large subunit
MAIVTPYGKGRTPLLKQRVFHISEDPFKAYIGGVGSGKTTCGCREVWYLAQKYPGTTIIVGRKTYMELIDSTRKAFFEMLATITEDMTGRQGDALLPKSCPFVHKFHKTENCLILYTGRGKPLSTVLFRSLDSYERFKSIELGAFYIDEASEIQNKDMYLMLAGRLRNPAQDGGYCGFITSNPCDKEHWIFDEFGTNRKGRLLVQAPTRENIHLPDNYENMLREMYNEDQVDRYIEGHFGAVLTGRPVYPEFTHKRHVANVKYNPKLPIVRGWDFGFENPGCVIGQIDGVRLLVFAEVLGHNELITSFAPRVLRLCKNMFGSGITTNNLKYEDFCDPAGNQKSDKSEKTSIEVLNSMKVFPYSRYQHVKDGVMIINMMLKTIYGANAGNLYTVDEKLDYWPALIVHPRCTNLIDCLVGLYRYSDIRDASGELKPQKKNDHLPDCVRYIISKPSFKYLWKRKQNAIKKREPDFNFWIKSTKDSKRGRTPQTFVA